MKNSDSDKKQNRKRAGVSEESQVMKQNGDSYGAFDVLQERRKEFTECFRSYSLHLIEAAQEIDREYKELIQQKNLSCASSDRCYVFPSLRIRKDEGYLSITWRKITRPYYFVKDFKGPKNSLWSYAVKLGNSEDDMVKAFKKYVPDWALPIVIKTEKDFERLLFEYRAYAEIRRKIRAFNKSFEIATPKTDYPKKSQRYSRNQEQDFPPDKEEEFEDEYLNPEL